MNRLLCFFFLLCVAPAPLLAATGDVSNVTVLANGTEIEFTVAGFSAAASYSFNYAGSGTPSAPGPTVPYLTVVSQGYIPGTTTLDTTTHIILISPQERLPYGTCYVTGTFNAGTFVDGEPVTQATSNATGVIVGDQAAGGRLIMKQIGGTGTAWDNSHQATGGISGATFTSSSTLSAYTVPTNHERDNGTGLVIRCALAQPVYLDDNTGAGKSGTAPTITLAAGLVVSGMNSSAAVSAGAVTNNSTQDYPTICLGQWDHIAGVCTGDRVTGAYDLAVNADHKWGVATVRFDADGVTSMANANATLSEADIVPTRRSGTGWSEEAWKKSGMSVSGFTTGERIWLRARIYPKVGDADNVLDTNNYTTIGEECRGANKAWVVYNSTPKYAYVALASDSPAGNDATAVASTNAATAAASPFLNPGKAIQNDATVIYGTAGVHPAIGSQSSTRRATNEWYVIQPAPGQSSSTVTFQVTTVTGTKCERLQYEGVTITLAGTTSYLDGGDADNATRFRNCVFDSSGVARPTSGGVNYNSDVTYFENCTGDLGRTGWFLNEVGPAPVASQFDGCTFTETDTASGSVGPWYRVVACTSTGGISFPPKNGTSTGPTQENAFFHNNSIRANDNTSQNLLTFGGTAAGAFDVTRGISIRGNLIERSSGSIRLVLINGDSSAFNSEHVIFCNNTLVGEGANVGYNDLGGNNYTRTNWEMSGNLSEGNLHTKHDTFVTAQSTLTRSGTTATFTAANTHGYVTGDRVTISGANLSQYNGSFLVTVTSPTAFTYVMGSDPGGSGTGATITGNPRRMNGWNVLYGTGQTGNVIAHITGTGAAGSFLREFPGAYSYQPAITPGTQPPGGSANATTFIQFVDRTLGAGDWRLRTASPAYQLLRQGTAAHRSQRYDMRGKPFASVRENAGCYAEGGVRPASMFFGAN